MTATTKLTILHLGDPIKHNPEIYTRLESHFNVIRPSNDERQRAVFITALKEKKWGNFDAIMRPFWNTGGEMGRWDRELVPLLPSTVKVFASAGAGYDWADVDVLGEYGIIYCNGAAASSEAVADMALFHILSVFRNLAWSQQAARSCDPAQFLDAHQNATLTSHNPRGHSLGIIGLGNIGYTIAQKAYAAFGMDILYNDLYRKSKAQENAIGGATFFANLDDLLAEADCVLVATPFSGKKLIDSERLSRFKPGARFVNIARGSLVDESALVAALQNGHLHAAGLDVHADEPNVKPILAKDTRVTMTCHNAGGAIETNIGFERLAMENVEAVLLGHEPLTAVNMRFLKR